MYFEILIQNANFFNLLNINLPRSEIVVKISPFSTFSSSITTSGDSVLIISARDSVDISGDSVETSVVSVQKSGASVKKSGNPVNASGNSVEKYVDSDKTSGDSVEPSSDKICDDSAKVGKPVLTFSSFSSFEVKDPRWTSSCNI